MTNKHVIKNDLLTIRWVGAVAHYNVLVDQSAQTPGQTHTHTHTAAGQFLSSVQPVLA